MKVLYFALVLLLPFLGFCQKMVKGATATRDEVSGVYEASYSNALITDILILLPDGRYKRTVRSGKGPTREFMSSWSLTPGVPAYVDLASYDVSDLGPDTEPDRVDAYLPLTFPLLGGVRIGIDTADRGAYRMTSRSFEE